MSNKSEMQEISGRLRAFIDTNYAEITQVDEEIHRMQCRRSQLKGRTEGYELSKQIIDDRIAEYDAEESAVEMSRTCDICGEIIVEGGGSLVAGEREIDFCQVHWDKFEATLDEFLDSQYEEDK